MRKQVNYLFIVLFNYYFIYIISEYYIFNIDTLQCSVWMTFWFIFCPILVSALSRHLCNFCLEAKPSFWPSQLCSTTPKSLPLFHFNLSLRSMAEFAAFSRRMLCSSQARCTFPVAHYHSELQKPGLSGGQKRTWKADLRPSSERNRSIRISCDHLQKFLQPDWGKPSVLSVSTQVHRFLFWLIVMICSNMTTDIWFRSKNYQL